MQQSLEALFQRKIQFPAAVSVLERLGITEDL